MTLIKAGCYNAPLALLAWRALIYAIVESGGKQYKVAPGQKVKVDLLGAPPGNRVEFNRVLFIADGEKALIGRPLVDGARVIASCLTEAKGRKVIAFKYHRKNRYRRKLGHRQPYTELTIQRILKPGEVEPESPVEPGPKRKEAPEAPVPTPEVKAEKPKAKATAKKAVLKAKAKAVPEADEAEKKAVKPKAATKKAAAEAPKPKTTRKKTSPKAEEK